MTKLFLKMFDVVDWPRVKRLNNNMDDYYRSVIAFDPHK